MSKLFIPLGSNCATTYIGMICGWCRSINEQLIIIGTLSNINKKLY